MKLKRLLTTKNIFISLSVAVVLSLVLINAVGLSASGYGYYRIITIESDHVDSTLTNVPVYLSFTSSLNATVANGGHVQNTTTGGASGSDTIPADLIFCDDYACTTVYSHEIVKYSATTGLLETWIEIPSVPHDADSTFYMHYGNSSVSTNQENIAGTWSNGYEGVYHFANLGVQDSSGNNNDATDNASLGGGSGLVGDAVGVDTNDYYTTPNNASLDFGTDDFTLIGSFKVDNDGGALFSYGDRADSQGITCYIATTAQCLLDDATDQVSIDVATDFTDNAWHLFAFVADRDGNGTVYVDGNPGTPIDITSIGTLTSTDAGFFDLGRLHYSGGYPSASYLGTPNNAYFDEIFFVRGLRSADEIEVLTNLLIDQNLLSMGAEQSATATATPTATATATPTATATATATPTPTPTGSPPAILMGESSITVPSGLETAIENALGVYRPDSELGLDYDDRANMWAISYYGESSVSDYYWISVNGLVVDDTGDLDGWDLSRALWSGMAVAYDNGDTTYSAHISGSVGYSNMLATAGLSDIANPDVGGTGSSTYYFPFPPGYVAYYGTKGVHSDVGPPGTGYGGMGWRAIDWVGGITYSADIFPNSVYVSQSGSVSYVCKDSIQTWVQIGDFLYGHLNDNETLEYGYYHSQGSYLGSLVTGPHSTNCGSMSQQTTSYHLHIGFKPTGDYFRWEDWVLTISDETFRRGGSAVSPGQYMLAEWAVRPIVPTPGPTVTPGGPTVTPIPYDYPTEDQGGSGGHIWDGFINGMKILVQERVDMLNDPNYQPPDMPEEVTLPLMIMSGVRIAIRSVFVLVKSNLNMTVTLSVVFLLIALESVRMFRAIWIGIKDMIPFIG